MKNLLPAVILIVIGGLLLANNLGYTSVSLGRFISTWWPALLIIAGLGMLLRGRKG